MAVLVTQINAIVIKCDAEKLEIPKTNGIVVECDVSKKLKPTQSWFVFFVAAAIARKVYLRPGRGVGGLSKAFGTKARRGTMTNTHKPASTGIIRHVLQQLESLKVRNNPVCGDILDA